jgi:hypothetical protein
MARLSITSLAFFLAALSFGPLAHGAQAEGSFDEVAERIYRQHSSIPQAALDKAMAYYNQNPNEVTNKNYITIIDFDQPSTDYRMHVIDMITGTISSYLVAHGVNSGELYADHFSNAEGSLESSLGIYLTGQSYIGEHGLSLRLVGKEATNSNAFARDIVLHGADYVSEAFIAANGRLGRSDGCTAVEMQYSTDLVNELENGSVYLIYKR